MKYLSSFFTFLFFLNFSAQKKVSFSELPTLQKQEKKWTMVFLHTYWCGYCKIMEEKIFKEKEILNLLNEKFYLISFNAETQEEIIFNDQKYRYIVRGKDIGSQQLSDFFHNSEKESYPKTFFLNTDNQIVYQISGFIKARELKNILKKISQIPPNTKKPSS